MFEECKTSRPMGNCSLLRNPMRTPFRVVYDRHAEWIFGFFQRRGVEYHTDYTDAAESFVVKHLNIAGGCRGRSADGLQWTCYLGQRAVDEGILAADLLGQYSPSPGRG
jgi:hypothetical protein